MNSIERPAMSIIPAAALLDAWDRGRDASPGERGLILLGMAHPGASASALSEWSVGRRDAALLTLLDQNFGPTLEAVAECPRCHDSLEMEFPVSTIAIQPPRDERDQFVLEHAGRRVTYRLPTAGDLAALGTGASTWDSAQSATRWLIERCVVAIDRTDATGQRSDDDRDVETAVPETVLGALETAIAKAVATADPQAEIELALTCPSCSLQWKTPFDIVNFLWEEIEAQAAHLLTEIHILASTYHWSERDILALNPWRRRYYLDLIGA
jgi:hypothetical protein